MTSFPIAVWKYLVFQWLILEAWSQCLSQALMSHCHQASVRCPILSPLPHTLLGKACFPFLAAPLFLPCFLTLSSQLCGCRQAAKNNNKNPDRHPKTKPLQKTTRRLPSLLPVSICLSRCYCPAQHHLLAQCREGSGGELLWRRSCFGGGPEWLLSCFLILCLHPLRTTGAGSVIVGRKGVMLSSMSDFLLNWGGGS